MARETSYNELLDSVFERMVEIDPDFSIDALKTSVESDENLRSILIGEEIDRRQWIEAITNDLTSRDYCQGDSKLGTSYSLRDLFVKKKTEKKTEEKELCLQSKQVTKKFTVINNDEVTRMLSKGYGLLHLEGVEFTCYSRLPPGSDGFALAVVYDNRLLKAKDGFLGLVAFPLGLKKSSAVIRTTHSVSAQNASVWTVVICEHGLKDKSHPYTIRMKTVCKYARSCFTNFTFASEMKSFFLISIEESKNLQAIEAVKQALCKTSTRLSMDFIFNASDGDKKKLLKMNEVLMSKLSRSLSLDTRSNLQNQSEVERRKSSYLVK